MTQQQIDERIARVRSNIETTEEILAEADAEYLASWGESERQSLAMYRRKLAELEAA